MELISDTYKQESAFDLFVSLQASWLFLKCGCPNIDSLLHGGILKGEITEIVGAIAVGKTQVCSSLCYFTKKKWLYEKMQSELSTNCKLFIKRFFNFFSFA